MRRGQKKPSEQKTFLMVDKFTRGKVEKIHFDFAEEKKKAEERKAKGKRKHLGQHLSSKYGWSTIKIWLYLTHNNCKAKLSNLAHCRPSHLIATQENFC